MRVLHYSHDTSGTGHIRRTLAVAAQVALDFPQATQLLVSGTPQPRRSKLPHKLDFIKLPCMNKSFKVGNQYPTHELPIGRIKTLREKIILHAVKHFDPDVVFVNMAFDEEDGALARSLNYIKQERPETKLAIGTNHLEDDALMVRNALLASKVGDSIYTWGGKADHDKIITSHNKYSQTLVAAA